MAALTITLVLLCASEGYAIERDISIPWCKAHNGQSEVILNDGSRADCITKHYVIEAEFSRTWAWGVGQVLFYAIMTDKKPAILYIPEGKPSDDAHYARLRMTADKYDIKIFKVKK